MTLVLLAALCLVQDDPKSQLKNWSKSFRSGDLKSAYGAMKKLAKDGDASTRAAADFRKEEEKRLAGPMKEARAKMDAITAKAEKRSSIAKKEWEEIDRAMTALNDSICLMQEQLDLLARFPRDLELWTTWQSGAPALRDGDGAVRSFEYFGTMGDWENAAKCLASGDAKEAQLHFKTIAAARKAAPRAAHWEFYSDGRTWFASLTTFLRDKDVPWKAWKDDASGAMVFWDTTAVLRLEVGDEAVRIDTAWKGNTLTPAK
jgi:hypothetical protein